MAEAARWRRHIEMSETGNLKTIKGTSKSLSFARKISETVKQSGPCHLKIISGNRPQCNSYLSRASSTFFHSFDRSIGEHDSALLMKHYH
jgi:hypothetical protein